MVGLKAIVFTTLLIAHSANASCDGSQAEALVQHIDQFHSLLINYAALGSSLAVAEAAVSMETSTGKHHLAARFVETKEPPPAQKQEVSNKNVKFNQQIQKAPSKLQPPSKVNHVSSKVGAELHHTHLEPKAQVTSFSTKKGTEQQQPMKVKTKEEAPHQLSPLSKVHSALQPQIQESFKKLTEQQAQLNTFSNICVPMSHKLRIISSLSGLLSVYTGQEKNLRSAGKLVTKIKSASAHKKVQKQKRSNIVQEAGWMTMNDEVNGGYNDETSVLTAQSCSSEATTLAPLGEYGYGNSVPVPYTISAPQYRAEYITVTTTEVQSSTPSSSAGGSDDSDSDSDDDSDDEGTSSSAAGVPSPAETSKHHNIIVRTFDGTLHLVEGTVDLARFILHLVIGGGGGSKKQAAPAPQAAINDDSTNELSKLVNNVARLYKIKI